MDFEDLKVIWDSQNQEPVFTLNQTALHAIVRRRNEETHASSACMHRFESIGGAVMATLMFAAGAVLGFGDPAWLMTFSWIRASVSPWDVAAMMAAGVIWAYYSNYMWSARRRQLQREQDFASSLQGDLDRALAHLDFRIRVARNIVWRGVIPIWVASGLWVLVLFHLKGALLAAHAGTGLLMVAALALTVGYYRRSITNRFSPVRRELEELRAKLADPQR